MTNASTFWDWFTATTHRWEAANPDIAAAAKAANYQVGHTGGGCLALECTEFGVWFLLTDDDADLPTDLDQPCVAGASVNEDGRNIAGIDTITPRELFAVHRTFGQLCGHIHRKFLADEGGLDVVYVDAADMLTEAVERGCVHPSEAATVNLIISLKNRDQRK